MLKACQPPGPDAAYLIYKKCLYEQVKHVCRGEKTGV